MKCLILGGNGFLGRNLCLWLLKEGFEVRVFDRPIANKDKPDLDVEWFEGDFLNSQDLESAMTGCDVVFHLITMSLPQSSNDNPIYDVQSNLVGTIEMLNLAVKLGIKKVIFPSSGGTVYGVPEKTPIPETHPTNPLCSYGITKLAIEKYLHLFHELYGIDYCVLRIANPFGEGQRMDALQGAIGVFIGKAIQGKPIEIWGDGSIVRDYIHVGDVSSAFVKAVSYNGATKVFNIGSGMGRSINQILDEIEKGLETSVNRIYQKARKVDVPISVLDRTLAHLELSWEPKVQFDEGINKTLNHYLHQLNILGER